MAQLCGPSINRREIRRTSPGCEIGSIGEPHHDRNNEQHPGRKHAAAGRDRQACVQHHPRIAQRKAATNTLPIPSFRINGTRKGPLYVLREDLEKWIKDRADRAKDQHRKMQAV